MTSNLLTFTGSAFFVVFVMCSYLPLSTRLSMPDAQAWQYGPMFLQVLPLIIIIVAVFGSALILIAGSRMAQGTK